MRNGCTHMDAHDWYVYVIQQFMMELHRHAGIEENHDLLLTVLLQEGEEKQKTLVGRTHHISLNMRKTTKKAT